VLKSFIIGSFGACGSKTQTTPEDSSGGSIANQSVTIGLGKVTVQDKAVVTVTGTTSFGGTVTFHLCGPADLAAQPSCIAGGTLIGSAKLVSGPSPATVTSDQATVTSAATAPVGASGNYCWRAEYSGDSSVGVPKSFDSSTTECFTVTPVTPTLTTQASASTTLNNPISDTASLTGTAAEPTSPVIQQGGPGTLGSPASGTITFTAFGPNDCSTQAFTATVSVSGDSASYGPVSFTPTAVGTYTFVASYSGDSPNTNAVPATACPDKSGKETVTVTDTSSETSGQTWVPNDTATVTSGSGKATLNGSLKLQLYTGTGCATGNEVSGQLYGPTPVTGASSATISSTNSTFTISGNGSHSVSWLVTFTPTANSNVSSSSHCENSTVTISN
jgi:hypothetical protein